MKETACPLENPCRTFQPRQKIFREKLAHTGENDYFLQFLQKEKTYLIFLYYILITIPSKYARLRALHTSTFQVFSRSLKNS